MRSKFMSTHSSHDDNKPASLAILVAFIAVVVGVGALIGTQTAPGPWYEGLDKPFFNPPNWVFGPVWFTLYVMIAIAGWRTWMRGPKSAAMAAWIAQMIANWAWSPTFFVGQNLWLAMVIIVGILVAILTFIALTWRTDRVSALLFVPYAAWVSFASLLNLSLAIMN
jgi:translocator protein